MRSDLAVSPRFQNTQAPESLWSSMVRNAQRGKVIRCLEGKQMERLMLMRGSRAGQRQRGPGGREDESQ
jgi:hypothetical protein